MSRTFFVVTKSKSSVSIWKFVCEPFKIMVTKINMLGRSCLPLGYQLPHTGCFVLRREGFGFFENKGNGKFVKFSAPIVGLFLNFSSAFRCFNTMGLSVGDITWNKHTRSCTNRLSGSVNIFFSL